MTHDADRASLGIGRRDRAIAAHLPRPADKATRWAYAGFTIDLAGAIVSHVASHDAAHAPPAVFTLALLMVSYGLRGRAE